MFFKRFVVLKKTVLGFQQGEKSICCWCIWWRLWFLLRRRVWPILLEARDEQQFGSHEMRWLISCFEEPIVKLRMRSSRRYRWRKSSWCSWLWLKLQHQGELVSRRCRCRWCKIHVSFSCVSSRQLLRSFLLSFQLSSLLSWPLLGLVFLLLVRQTWWILRRTTACKCYQCFLSAFKTKNISIKKRDSTKSKNAITRCDWSSRFHHCLMAQSNWFKKQRLYPFFET